MFINVNSVYITLKNDCTSFAAEILGQELCSATEIYPIFLISTDQKSLTRPASISDPNVIACELLIYTCTFLRLKVGQFRPTFVHSLVKLGLK